MTREASCGTIRSGRWAKRSVFLLFEIDYVIFLLTATIPDHCSGTQFAQTIDEIILWNTYNWEANDGSR
jgi:hypothetical protein